MQKTNKPTLFFFLIILMVGIFLRFNALGSESLWIDESVSLLEAQQSIADMIMQITELEGSPYGHHLLLHYWIKWFDNSEFFVRLPSVIFSILTLIFFFSLTKEIYNQKIALLSTMFMSTAMLQIVYAQEARLYALYGFLLVFSSFALWRMTTGSRGYAVIYVLAMSSSFYVNYLTLVVLVIHYLMLSSFNRSKPILNKWYYSSLIIVILTIPLWPILGKQLLLRHNHLLTGLAARGIPSIFQGLGIFFFLLPVLIASFCGLYLLKKISHILEHKKVLISLGLLIAGTVYILLVDRRLITKSVSLVRHSYFIIPFFYIGLAQLVTSFKKRWSYLAILIIVLLNLFSLNSYYTEPTKPQWREAINFLDLNYLGEIVLTDDSESGKFLINYYGNKPYQLQIINDSIPKESFWLIAAYPQFKGRESFLATLNKRIQPTIEKEYYGIKIYYYLNASRKTGPLVNNGNKTIASS